MDLPIRNSSGPSFNFHSHDGSAHIKGSENSLRQTDDRNAEIRSDSKWTGKVFSTIISVSLVAIFFGVPLFFTGLTSQGLGFEKQMYFYFWILVALIAWVSDCVVKGEMDIRRTPLDIPIVIFWFAYLLSTIFSIDKWHSFWGFFGDPTHGLVNVTAGIVIYYIIMSHFNARRLRLMLGALLTSGFVVMVWEILIVRGMLKLQDANFLNAHHWAQYLPTSLIGSTSGTSVFLSALVALLVMSFIRTKSSSLSKTKKIALMSIFTAMILMAMYLLLAFYSFVPWPGILIGVGFFLIYILARIVHVEKGSTWLPMVVFAVVLIILLVGNVVATSSKLVAVQLPAEVGPQYQLSWQVAKEAIMNHNFFLGSGPATYGYDFSLYHPQSFNLNNFYNIMFFQGSGIFWEALPTLGALGTFALALLVFSFLSVGIYLLSREKGKNKIYSLGFMTAMIIILVDAFILRMDGSMIILGILIGTLALATVLNESDTKEEYLSLSLKASPKYALALAFVFLVVSAGVVFLFVFLGRVFVADVFAGMPGRQQAITEDNSVGPVVKAINLYNKEGRYYTFGGQQYMALANIEFAKGDKADSALIGQYLDNSIVLASKGKDLMPRDVTAIEALAQAYENKAAYSGQFFDQAITAYNDALALDPHSPDIYLKLGQLKAKLAGLEKDQDKKKELLSQAADMFQKSIDQKSNFAQGYYYLSLMQGQMGDIDKAIESAKNAVGINPQDASAVFNLAALYQKKGGDENLKIAEYLYKQILQVAPNDVNTHLGLGLLYEKENKKDEAVAQYQAVLDVLPKDSTTARTQVQTLIDNVRKGVSNEAQPAPAAAASAPSLPVDANINPADATIVPAEQTPAVAQ